MAGGLPPSEKRLSRAGRGSQRPAGSWRPSRLATPLAALLGVVGAYLITRHLAALPSSFISALLLAGGSLIIGRSLASWIWWAVLGASCGGLLGSAVVVAAKIQSTEPHQGFGLRLAILGCLIVAGAIGGRSLSLDAANPERRRPKDTLRSASGLTTGIFATLVTLAFLHSGLDEARALSSRLSTALTILVLAVSGPGWLVHWIGGAASPSQRQGSRNP